jgi:hypothetical protein
MNMFRTQAFYAPVGIVKENTESASWSVLFQFYSCTSSLHLYTRSPAPIYKGSGRLEKPPAIESINTIHLLFLFIFFIVFHLPCPSSPRAWLIFAVLSWKTVGSPPRKRGVFVALLEKQSSVVSRKHDNYPGVARQFCVPTQLATPLGTKHRVVFSLFLLRRERHQEAAIYTVTWILNLFM